jgi:ankyrin repeat protein
LIIDRSLKTFYMSAPQTLQKITRPEALQKDEPLMWSTGSGVDVWEMFVAAITGDVEKARQLLDKDPSLVRGSYDYRNPLSFAVQQNQLAVAALLLERGASPVSSGTNDTLLEIARDRGYEDMQKLLQSALGGKTGASPKGGAAAKLIRERDLEGLKKLLDSDPELVNAADEGTNRPIHWAVMSRQPDMIDELLFRGADINAQRGDGARPVQLVNGDYSYRGWRDVPADTKATPGDILRHLREKGAYIDICTAAHIGDIERVRQLLQEDPSVGNRVSDYVSYYIGSGSPLKNAAIRGHMDIVKLLIESGADPNLPEEGIAPRGHALHAAVCNGHIEIVKYLLDKGAYPNVDIESSADTLSAAIARDDKPMIELLCSYGAARNVNLLAYYGDVMTGAAVFNANPSLANDTYALECAAGEGNDAFVRLMLRYQPDLVKRISVGVRSRGPQSPVKTKELTGYLFEKGMDPSLRNWLGITPLHRFAERGDVENATAFLEHGADLNARDEQFCSTPLGWAAKYGKLEIAKLLLEKGARTNLPDDPSWATPLSWATRRGYKDIAALLKEHGATA